MSLIAAYIEADTRRSTVVGSINGGTVPMKMGVIRVSIFAILIYGSLMATALVGCYGSRSVSLVDGDDDGTDPTEYDGGDDAIDKPDADDDNRGADPMEYDGGDDAIDKPDADDDNRGTDPTEYDGGDDAIDKPDTEVDLSKEIESDVVQLSESEWAESTFSDRYDRRWFKVDVVVGNIYHIYIDDEFGSGLHYADEEIYVYEGEPLDLHEYFDYVDVYYGDDLVGFFEKPYEYKANFTGELYILLESDNPGYQTFEIRYEVISPAILI